MPAKLSDHRLHVLMAYCLAIFALVALLETDSGCRNSQRPSTDSSCVRTNSPSRGAPLAISAITPIVEPELPAGPTVSNFATAAASVDLFTMPDSVDLKTETDTVEFTILITPSGKVVVAGTEGFPAGVATAIKKDDAVKLVAVPSRRGVGVRPLGGRHSRDHRS